MRWRFGVEGPLCDASATEARLSSSLIDLRRLFAPRGGVFGAGCSAILFLALNVVDVAPSVNTGLGSSVGIRRARGGVWGPFGAGCSAALFLALTPVYVALAVNAGLGSRVGVRSARHGDCDRFVESRLWSARQVVKMSEVMVEEVRRCCRGAAGGDVIECARVCAMVCGGCAGRSQGKAEGSNIVCDCDCDVCDCGVCARGTVKS